jgi:hypothetical protein
MAEIWNRMPMSLAPTVLAPNLPFDGAPLWHRNAPQRFVSRWESANAEQRWTMWQKHLARRKQPFRPEFLSGKWPPLHWCWPDRWRRESFGLTIDNLAERAEEWIQGGSCDNADGLEAVALAYAMPELASRLPSHAWWSLAESLHDLARVAPPHAFETRAEPRELIEQQLLAGELPLALSYEFPELAPLAALGKPARQALSDAVLAMTDRRGEPHARLLPVLGPLFACWTRTRWLGERLKRGCWSRAAEMQYRWLVRRAVRLADGRKRFLCDDASADTPARDVRTLLATAIELAGDDADRAVAALAVAKSFSPSRSTTARVKLPKASFHSEWAGIAVLASGWPKSAPRLAVTYADDPSSLELHVGGRQIVAGKWLSATTCDGRPVAPNGEWEEICWQSDEDCDYLELSIELTEGLTLDRQILLAKEDDVLYLADIVVAGDRSVRRLRHSTSLPLGGDVTWRPEQATRDGLLAVGKQAVAVLPLGLHEWRSDPRGGTLDVSDGRLILSQSIEGAALCCPLVFDLNAKRSKKERTWRLLTVAEALQVVPRDTAAGFRAQSGRDQWLIYRSLGPAGNRTVLGQNISSEFFAGRFLPTGEADEWIEVEVTP